MSLIVFINATHFYRNGFTSDHAREEAGARYLARSFPHLAISNAENYEHFAVDASGSLRAHREHPIVSRTPCVKEAASRPLSQS
ncbi:hypothetical protein FKP32DRAFT_1300743 [Trametes sanguinea]|nr:hypothetical protein FKP32DRAFT_1300743 [Trametes sanguinea]